MAVGLTSQLFQRVTATDIFCQRNKFRSPEMRCSLPLPSTSFPSVADRQDRWGNNVLEGNYRPMLYTPRRYRSLGFRSFALPVPLKEIPLVKNASLVLTRSCDTLLANPATSLVVPAIGIIVFALWGFLPLMRDIRNLFDHGGNWKKSPTYLISSSYLQPLLLWTGATLICRGLDPVVLPSAASQAVKTRLITFVRSLSTVLAVAYILTSLIQQVQKFLVDMRSPNDSRNSNHIPENASVSNSEKQEQKKTVPEDARVKNGKIDNVTPVTPSVDPVTSTSKTGKGKTHEPEATERQGDRSVSVANTKKEFRPAFEDNIVLGVALEGSKRTLPIEEGNPYLSLSEAELDTVEAASSPQDNKIGQSPKLSGQEKNRSEESR